MIAEGSPEQDLLEEVVFTIQKGQTQSSLNEVATHSTQDTEPDGQSKLDGEEKLQPSLPELKPLPPGLKYAFLHNNRAPPVIISDKLTESETRRSLQFWRSTDPSSGTLCRTWRGLVLVLCNITNKIRKSTDTAVAFTQEYSRVSYPLGNVSTLPTGLGCPRTHILV